MGLKILFKRFKRKVWKIIKSIFKIACVFLKMVYTIFKFFIIEEKGERLKNIGIGLIYFIIIIFLLICITSLVFPNLFQSMRVNGEPLGNFLLELLKNIFKR